jgi:hypothetical protein
VSHFQDLVELWLVTAPAEAEGERRLYAAVGDLHTRFPESKVQLHVVNPRYFEDFDLTEIIPPGAEEIRLLLGTPGLGAA